MSCLRGGLQPLQRGCKPVRAKGRRRQSASRLSQPHLKAQASVYDDFQESADRQQLFNNISSVYDELNSQLSFGQHWVWKRMAIKWADVKRGDRVLDVCCGSGDITLLLAAAVGPQGQVVGLDFAADMLRDAAARAAARPATPRNGCPITWTQGDALDLPFSAGEFDAVTMGYGLRNVVDRPAAMRELLRVVRPGGKVSVLDFNNTTDPVVDALQAAALEYLVVPAAERYGLGDEYRYLRPSIKAFLTGPEQEALALEAGFTTATHYEVGFGQMGVLVASKT